MKYNWNLELLCTDEKWLEIYQELEQLITKLNKDIKSFLDNPTTFNSFLEEYIKANLQIEIVYCYPRRHLDISLKDEKYHNLLAKAINSYNHLLKLIYHFEQNILENSDLVKKYLEDKKVSFYKRYINLILRRKDHLLKNDTQKIKYEQNNQEIKQNYENMFNNGFKIENALVDGEKIEINRFNYNRLLLDKSPSKRRVIFELYTKEYIKNNDVLTQLYLSKLQNEIELSKKENFSSLLSKKLFELELDPVVFDPVLKQINENLRIMHEYTYLKKRMLSLEEFHLYDTGLLPSSTVKTKYSFEEALSIVKGALNVLGSDYISLIDKMFDEGWCDVYPKNDKRSYSYTCLSYVGAPYVLMNYDGSLNAIRTLAHEIGHALNAYYSKNKNSFAYFEIPYLLTEIASKVNELLLNDYLLKISTDEEMKKYVLNNNVSNLGNSLFGQIMLTEFEHTVIKKMEINEKISKEDLNNIYLKISQKYNGNGLTYDEYVKYGWSKISSFIMQDSYYLYQYSLGMAIATNISKRILAGEPNIVEKYKKFLAIGKRKSITQALSELDIDLQDGKYMAKAMEFLEQNITLLKEYFN